MILGFKEQFKPLILSGVKIHTVRIDKNKRWKNGRQIHFATNVRSKSFNCFKVDEVKSIQRVFMSYDWKLHISIDGKELFGYADRHQFANNDGFKSWEDLEDFFIPLLEKTEDKELSARLIHWTDFRY